MNIQGLSKQEGIQAGTTRFSKRGKKETTVFSSAFGSVMCCSTVIYQARSLLAHKITLKPYNPGGFRFGFLHLLTFIYGRILYFKLPEGRIGVFD